MKTLIAFLTLLSVHAMASTPDSRICTAVSKTHSLTLRETSDGVEGLFEDKKNVQWNPIRNYKLSGKLINKLTLEKLTLNEALNNRSLLTEMVVTMMRSRPEFDGEADMHHALAGEYTRDKLVCQ